MVKRLGTLVSHAMVVAFILMIVASSLQIITRYVFRAPLLGSEEVARLFGVWLYFLGASVGILMREHIAIDFIYLAAPPGVQRVFRLVTDVLLLLFHGVLFVEGTKYALFSHGFESASLRFPMSLFAAAVPTSAACILIFLGASIWQEIRRPVQSRRGEPC
jgi:TRAP-type C4-dicarboxylate transport system permease small subunit